MRKLVSLVLLGLMFSCSSAPKESDEVDTSAGASAPSAPLAFEKAAPDDAPATVPVNPPPKASSKAGNPLDEAIRSQNDENIRKQAHLALLQNPQDSKALNALAIYNYKRGRFTAAKYLLGRAIQNQPNGELYNNLGVVHLALNERKEAILAFRQALNMNSRDGVAAANIGAIFVKERDYNKALVALETAYKAGYRDFRVLNNYAIALTAKGQGSKAEDLYRKALDEQGNSKELLYNYSVLLIDHLKKYKEGSEVLNRLKFVGIPSEQRDRIKDLENKVKLGLQ